MKAVSRRDMRRRALEEWRGLPEKVISYDRMRTLADSVPKCLKGIGLKERYDEQEMLLAWREMVGDFIALHSRPVKVERNVLIVQVLQPTLHYDLERTLKGKLLGRIQERFGARRIRDIRFLRG